MIHKHSVLKKLAWLVFTFGNLALWPAPARPEATIEGTVKIGDRPPAPATPPRYQIKNDKAPVAPEAPAAVVYLDGTFSSAPATNAAVKLEQENFQFHPGLLPIRRGTTVEFPNKDDDYHNVFSYSKTKRFDLGRYRKDEKPASVVFDKAGVVKVYCEIHEHMRSTIVVLDTPYFTKTGTNGTYRLEHLPAGKFVLKAWLDEKTTLEQPVELKEGQNLRVDLPAK